MLRADRRPHACGSPSPNRERYSRGHRGDHALHRQRAASAATSRSAPRPTSVRTSATLPLHPALASGLVPASVAGSAPASRICVPSSELPRDAATQRPAANELGDGGRASITVSARACPCSTATTTGQALQPSSTLAPRATSSRAMSSVLHDWRVLVLSGELLARRAGRSVHLRRRLRSDCGLLRHLHAEAHVPGGLSVRYGL